jgi:hypothetical protein
MIKSKINLLKSIIYQIFSGFNISNIINLLYNEGRGSDDGIKPVRVSIMISPQTTLISGGPCF